MPLTVDIVTAERLVLSEQGVDEVVVPGIEGELAVLPMHAPLLTMVKPGVMVIKRGSDETEMAITGGFLEVREDKVTILADAAERAEEIDIARAPKRRAGAPSNSSSDAIARRIWSARPPSSRRRSFA